MSRTMADRDHDPEPAPVGRAVRLGYARLLPDVDRERAWLLTLDGAPQSYVDLDDPRYLEFEYARRLGHVVDTAAPPGVPLDVVHLGGGGLTLPRYVAATRPGSRQTVVEADGALTDFVLEHLPLPAGAGVRLVAEDARAALAGLPRGEADLLVVDVFAGTRVPAHLTSLQFAREAAASLRPGGLYAVNLADGPPLAFARAQVATVRAVFEQVCVLAESAVLRGRRFGNVVLLAADGALPVAGLARRLAGDPFPARVEHGERAERFAADAEPVDDAAATASPEPPDGAFDLG
jgi:spermidine synthase